MRQDDPIDPKGLIREAFRIDGISAPECRSIFVDWALSQTAPDPSPAIRALLDRHGHEPETHPMRAVLTEGLAQAPAAKRRGGRNARLKTNG
ncbi:hypothetical protein V8J82_15425 [Gymnodinialimonas sp. 2305UL16-5]|uniref:hypothetical protein n=1 Tax=Gymnodinialimonas mytili TaxID=3126503 RepID=UPI0030AECF95